MAPAAPKGRIVHPTEMFRCEDCGQITKVEKVGTLCTVKPKACPWCASAGITPVRSAFVALEAQCFKGVDKELVQLLVSQWASPNEDEEDPKPDFPFFLDYMLSLLTPNE